MVMYHIIYSKTALFINKFKVVGGNDYGKNNRFFESVQW